MDLATVYSTACCCFVVVKPSGWRTRCATTRPTSTRPSPATLPLPPIQTARPG